MPETVSRCDTRWWTSNDPCPVEPGEHACRRVEDHRTHICECSAVRIAAVETAPTSPCGRRWIEGRQCADIEHVCQREGEHDTHVCGCLATDTPSRAGLLV